MMSLSLKALLGCALGIVLRRSITEMKPFHNRRADPIPELRPGYHESRRAGKLRIALLAPFWFMGEKLNLKRFWRSEMTNMQDREKAFEIEFALDEELKFKAEARRNKLLGLWAAELLGKSDPAAYAKEVVAADFRKLAMRDVVRKVRADFDAAGIVC